MTLTATQVCGQINALIDESCHCGWRASAIVSAPRWARAVQLCAACIACTRCACPKPLQSQLRVPQCAAPAEFLLSACRSFSCDISTLLSTQPECARHAVLARLASRPAFESYLDPASALCRSCLIRVCSVQCFVYGGILEKGTQY